MILSDYKYKEKYAIEFPLNLDCVHLAITFKNEELEKSDIEKYLKDTIQKYVGEKVEKKNGECIIEAGFYFSYKMDPLLLLQKVKIEEVGQVVVTFLINESNNDGKFYQYAVLPWTDPIDFLKKGFEKGGLHLTVMCGESADQPLPDISQLKNKSIHCYHIPHQSLYLEFGLSKQSNGF